MSNLDKPLQEPNIYGIYITFFKTRSGDFVVTPLWGARVKNTRGGGARDRQQMRFQTYSHSDFKFYDDLFYLDYKYKGPRRRAKPGVAENIH